MPRVKRAPPPISIYKVQLHFNCAGLTSGEQAQFIAHFEHTMRTHPLVAPGAVSALRVVHDSASRELLTVYRALANHSCDEAGVHLGRVLFPLLFQLRRTAIARLDEAEKVNAKGSEQ